MARGAGRGESDGHVRRAVRPCVVCFVAGIAISGHRCVVVIYMALSARNGRMGARQRKCSCRMVEARRTPAAGSVAKRTIRWERGCDVIGSSGPGKVGLMAGVACCRRVYVVVVHVTLRACYRRMHSG